MKRRSYVVQCKGIKGYVHGYKSQKVEGPDNKAKAGTAGIRGGGEEKTQNRCQGSYAGAGGS